MQELKLLTLEVENQILQLAEKYRQLQDENKSLRQKNKELKGIVNILESKIKIQREELAKYKLTAMLNNNGDNAEVKQKINQLVREIDKCIKLLNE
ncbi:MAG: hypothetical protein LBH82_02370 [Bacteroidales bacterium]|jgi:uncharacterized protein (DUF3084 family)|nr:hypothetical protein [Bacteroidales bacterium]